MKTKISPKRAKPNRTKQTAPLRRRTGNSSAKSSAWIQTLAAPYLQGYEARPAREHGLDGYWFLANAVAQSEKASNKSLRRATKREATVGFFVGYLTATEKEYSFLHPEPSECLVFASITPAGSELHEKLVTQPGSLMRKTFEYIRWLTHRPPRFVFHEAEAAAMARHASMKDWSPEKREHLSRNFFIETLAWLVRSGLVRKLREEAMLVRDEQKAQTE